MPPKKRQYGDLGNERSPFNSPSSSIRINDLTASPTQQYQRAPKQPRTASNTYPAQTATGSSQLDALVIDSDNEYDASQEEPDSTQGYNEQQYSYSLYGTLNNKIVGVRTTMATPPSARWSSAGASLTTATIEMRSRS